MGIANRIINILVLVAAIAAVVCAYLLFQKREQIAKGREMMAKSVVENVRKIDKTVKISEDEMSLAKKPEDLEKPLKSLKTAVTRIFDQRNALASGFAEAVNTVSGEATLDGAALSEFTTSAEKAQTGLTVVKDKIAYVNDRDDKVRTGLKKFASSVNEELIPQTELADNEKLAEAFGKYSDKSGKYVDLFGKYGSHIRSVSEKLNLEKTPTLDIGNASVAADLSRNLEEIDTYVANVEKVKKEREEFEKKVTALAAEMKQREESVKKALGSVQGLQKQLNDSKKEIARLKRIIDPTGAGEGDGANGNGTVASDFSLLRSMTGKITYVNEKFGFVTIDLGSRSSIVRKSDNQEIRFPAPIPSDSILTVATSLEPEKAAYVGRLVLARLGAQSSIATILPNPGGAQPKVGDIVFFSESDIAQMKALREAALKKSDEEKRREQQRQAEEAVLAGDNVKEEPAPAAPAVPAKQNDAEMDAESETSSDAEESSDAEDDADEEEE